MREEQENWELIQQLFYLAEEAPEEQREQVLREHCADPRVVARALEILDSFAAAEQAAPRKVAPQQAQRIGPYALLRQIGAGGIGTVYLAERISGGVLKRLALKMLAPHAAGDSFIERFHREQHILGSLDHPNITRFIDAGLSDSGQRYLVMEYVDGEHLDAFCDHRKLGVSERLRLFLDVCDAVAYAHRNLIVHLDLKPSNILVSQDGVVKLLDFGTSKLIETNSLLTTTVLATPAYASPEQLRNEPVTTACDVYALGAILFELLTGRRPYANSSVAAMVERAITEQRPESPLNAITAQGAQDRGVTEQRLLQIISGDLQTIVQKCLEARPLERYGSVDALAQDVKRYLDGEPVLARRQTTIYRLGKFIRRHRVGVAVGLATAALLVGSLGYAVWRQQQALREARRAERMQTFMHQLFRLANSNYTGKPSATVPEFLQLGVKILPDYIRNPSDLLQAKVALAESIFDNGDLSGAEKVFQQTGATAASMNNADAEAESKAFAGHIKFLQGDVAGGEQLTAEALRLSRQKGVSPTVRVWAADFYASDRENLGLITDENLDLLHFAANEARSNRLPPHETATAIYSLATNLEYVGKLDEASPLYDGALSLFEQDTDDVCDPAAVYGDIGYLHYLKNDPAGSLPFFQRSYDGYKRCSGAASRDALSILSYMADSLILVGRTQEAISLLEGSWHDWEKISGGYVSLSEYPLALAEAYNAAGRHSEAEKLIETIIDTRRAKIPKSSSSLCEFFLAQALAGEHRYQDALPHGDLALRAFRISNPKITLSPFGYTVRAQVEATDADIRLHLGLPKLP